MPLPVNFSAFDHSMIMKSISLLLLSLGLGALQVHAQSEMRYFRLVTPAANGEPEYEESISLFVSEDYAGGTEFAGSAETHSAYGNLTAVVRPDGIIHATWNYEIEGSEQSEEQLLKLDGDTLYLGEGELEERGPGQMVLKDPAAVVFEKALKEVAMSELPANAEEAAASVAALKAEIAKLAGGAVELDGMLRETQGWVRFLGYLAPAEGATLQNAEFAGRFPNEFQIQVKKDGDQWKLIRHGFRGAEGYFELTEASEEYESAPWPLEEEMLP